MELTNKFNLPGPLVKAVQGFDTSYKDSRGETKLSVTQLIQPPLIRKLTEEHWDEIEEDVSERIWSLLGSAVHSILEHAGGQNDLTEERIFAEVKGVKISGQADLYEANGTLSDYKVTSAWAVLDGRVKPEWVQQLNILAYLYESAGFVVNKLQIVAVLRDWSKTKAKSDTYPECAVKVIDIPRWGPKEIINYMENRVKLHLLPGVPPVCTDVERWHKPDQWAVMKKGRKSAVRLLDSEKDADARRYVEVKKGKGTYYVEHRPGMDTRCNDYCSVCKWCPYKKGKQDV